MTPLATWREAIPTSLHAFKDQLAGAGDALARRHILITAVLWSLHEVNAEDRWSVLDAIVGHEDADRVLAMLGSMPADRRLLGEQVSRQLAGDARLALMLDRILIYFLDTLFDQHILSSQAPANIDIDGNVSGAIVNIGGRQYFLDKVVIQQILPRAPRACPTAPPPPAHFAGREDELAQLRLRLLQGQNTALLSVQGMGGIGKSALAKKFVSEATTFGAVLWAELGRTPLASEHLQAWPRYARSEYKVQGEATQHVVSEVRALLTDLVRERCPGPSLVILDDVWEGQSLAVAQQLRDAAPEGAALLITTRSDRVAAQLRGMPLRVGPLSPAEALQLLHNLLADLPELNDESLLALAEIVGHHPLALELAAGQVHLLERPSREIDDLLDRYRGGIPAGSPFHTIDLELGDDRENNLTLVLAFSYESLNEKERAAFRALGILAYDATFSAPLCDALWQEAEPRLLLDALRHRALVALDEIPGRYRQHALLRAYARALLRHSDAGAQRQLVIEKYQQWAAMQLLSVLGPSAVADASSRLMPEHAHLREAVTLLAADERHDNAREMALWLGTQLELWGEQRHVPQMHAGIGANKRPDLIVRTSMALANAHMALGRYRLALQQYRLALAHAPSPDPTGSRAAAHGGIAACLAGLGRMGQAIEQYEQALLLATTQEDPELQARWHTGLGNCMQTMGHLSDAEEHYLRALALVEGSAYPLLALQIKNDVRNNSALNAVQQGHSEQAVPVYEALLEEARVAHNRLLEARALANCGWCQVRMAQYESAGNRLQEALDLARSYGFREIEAGIHHSLADLHSDRQKWTAAEEAARACIAIARELHNRELLAYGNSALARALLAQNSPEEAAAAAHSALRAALPAQRPDAYLLQGASQIRQGMSRAARTSFRSALHHATPLAHGGEHAPARFWQALALRGLADSGLTEYEVVAEQPLESVMALPVDAALAHRAGELRQHFSC